MKIRYNLAGKTLRSDIAAMVATTGATTRQAIAEWAETKFGAWAERNETPPIEVLSSDHESVTLQMDALTGEGFLREVGGLEIG